MEDIGLDYSLYLHEMYISCCLRRASHVARDAHLMQMDYCVDGGRQISCSQAEGEEMVSDQGFDELPAEVCTYDTFHYCAQQESKQRAQPRFQGLVCLAASHQSPAKAPRKGPRMMPQGMKNNPTMVPMRQPRVPHRLPPLYLLPSIGTK